MPFTPLVSTSVRVFFLDYVIFFMLCIFHLFVFFVYRFALILFLLLFVSYRDGLMVLRCIFYNQYFFFFLREN